MSKQFIFFGLIVAMFLAIAISPFASSLPDGLERVAQDLGFFAKAEIKPIITSPVPDYAWPGVKNEKIATSLAGFLGTLLVFAMGYAVALLIKRNNLHTK